MSLLLVHRLIIFCIQFPCGEYQVCKLCTQRKRAIKIDKHKFGFLSQNITLKIFTQMNWWCFHMYAYKTWATSPKGQSFLIIITFFPCAYQLLSTICSSFICLKSKHGSGDWWLLPNFHSLWIYLTFSSLIHDLLGLREGYILSWCLRFLFVGCGNSCNLWSSKNTSCKALRS
jgi:hypothetical protein